LKSRISSVRWRLVMGLASLAAAILLTLPGGGLRPLHGPVGGISSNLVSQVADVIWPNDAVIDDIIWPNIWDPD